MSKEMESEQLAALKKANEDLAFQLFLMKLNLHPAQNQENRQ